VWDADGRLLNARGVHLVDWDGFVANPTVTVSLHPPPDIGFPATATLRGDHPRLYFDLPSTVGEGGPEKHVRFWTASSVVTVRVAIFPDRDGEDEVHRLTLAVDGDESRSETVPVFVHDQDRNLPLLSRIVVDFSQDRTGFFSNAEARRVVEQAADDWAYFLADMGTDAVPAKDESTMIWNPDGFVSARDVDNSATYSGFLLYTYGIRGVEVRSGGEGSPRGKPPTAAGASLPLLRSGGLELEVRGNFNTLGWVMDTEPDTWWRSANRGREQNDLYSIVHHEMGHAHGFDRGYPRFRAAMEGDAKGLTSKDLADYHGGPLAIDSHAHFDGTIDPASGVGAFGYEYHGVMPARRWLITRTDLLALAAVGYALRPIAFDSWSDDRPECDGAPTGR
jgi:hypothetical protein